METKHEAWRAFPVCLAALPDTHQYFYSFKVIGEMVQPFYSKGFPETDSVVRISSMSTVLIFPWWVSVSLGAIRITSSITRSATGVVYDRALC
jgi:hypothetical protein